MTNYNDGQWHGWNGGECPVHPKTIVEAVTTFPGKRHGEAGILLWGCPGYVGESIVAFRVVKEHREPREWWLQLNDLGRVVSASESEPKNPKCSELVRLREVIE